MSHIFWDTLYNNQLTIDDMTQHPLLCHPIPVKFQDMYIFTSITYRVDLEWNNLCTNRHHNDSDSSVSVYTDCVCRRNHIPFVTLQIG